MMKTETEWREHICSLLPEEPSLNVILEPEHKEDLGGPVIIYSRESVEVEPRDLYEIALGATSKRRTAWGALCRCTSCTETFTAGWMDNSIVLLEGEDGQLYEGWNDGTDYDCIKISSGEMLNCPLCGEHSRLIKRSSIPHGGYTMRTQVSELLRIEDTTVLMFYIASRAITKNGYSEISYTPREAVAISPLGRFYRFSHTKRFMTSERIEENWRYVKTFRDPELVSWCAEGSSPYSRKLGGYSAKQIPEMKGSTGEKTGIDAYWGNAWPGSYLELWRKYPNVENIARAGAHIIAEVVDICTNTSYGAHRINLENAAQKLNLKKAKPHEILGITKEEWRVFKKAPSSYSEIMEYRLYKSSHKTSAEEFLFILSRLPLRDISRMNVEHKEISLPKLIRYLDKTGIALIFFTDYLKMMKKISDYYGTGPLTDEECFPRDIKAAHDRAAEIERQIELEKAEKQAKENEGRFLSVAEKYSGLEWSDGNICIVLPKSTKDLVAEGHILHHCVGGYTEQHLNGKPVFFVRHARRPERSWFTLNENLTGDNPFRIQLHGFHNELYSGKQLHIPAEVLDFCTRWEKEILSPWFNQYKKERRKAVNE